MEEKLIKSKKRVKDFAEVYTPQFIVKDMCDLIPSDIWENIESSFLEGFSSKERYNTIKNLEFNKLCPDNNLHI